MAPERHSTTRKQCVDRSRPAAEHGGDVVVGEVMHVTQHQCELLLDRQFREATLQLLASRKHAVEIRPLLGRFTRLTEAFQRHLMVYATATMSERPASATNGDAMNPSVECFGIAQPIERAQDLNSDVLRDIAGLFTIAQDRGGSPQGETGRPARDPFRGPGLTRSAGAHPVADRCRSIQIAHHSSSGRGQAKTLQHGTAPI